MKTPSPRAFYSGVFILSGLLMMLQVLQARIFSVTTWYHLSFLVISVAMFGLTLGALHVHKGSEAEQRQNYARLMGYACLNFAIFTAFALATHMILPIVAASLKKTLMTLPMTALCTVPSYYFAGYALCLAITRAPYAPARTYAFDLLGAAAGCLAALGLMETVDAPSAVMIVAAGAALASLCFGTPDRLRACVISGVLLVLALCNTQFARPFVYPLWVKNHIVTQGSLAHDQWNSISRVTVDHAVEDARPFLWGPSKTMPDDMTSSFYLLKIDGDAGTPINKFGGDCRKGLETLDYDVTTIAYALPRLKKSGIIGVGGGRDVLSACKAGIRDITAMDVNDIQISLLSNIEPFKSYANISTLKGVKLIHSEARSWFASHPDTFDIIQMSLIDTWAATGAGAFALSENGLYTVEAWRTFLSRLNDGGVMTVSRWYISDAQSEVERLVSLAMGALLEQGATAPQKHLFMAASDRIATLVLAKDPFTVEQLAALEKRASAMKFRVLISPQRKTAKGDLANILSARTRGSLDSVAGASAFDISPPTDQRPFFFNMVRLAQPFAIFRLISENNASAMLGHAKAVLNLYIIILFSLAMVAGAIIWPLREAVKNLDKRFVAGGTAWFALIGAGFMFIEIALLQRLSVYLGHPAYALGIVLFSLVLSTGVGSLICDRLPLDTPRARNAWAALTAIAAFAAIFAINAITTHFAGAELLTRALLCVSVTLPLGCLLGFGFPTGMALARAVSTQPAAWFWGINGAAGVTASAVAVALNISLGLDVTMSIGALCYLALLVPARLMK